MFTMDDLFEIAIKMENNGENTYKNATKTIENQELESILLWMANEEVSHAIWFEDQKAKLDLEMDETRLKQMVPEALKGMMGDKTLSLIEVDFNKFKDIPQLLKAFIGFENDTIMFYELLEMFIDDKKVLNGIKEIILEEKNHIEKLQLMMQSFKDEVLLH
jgi:rubrerythrin